MNNKKIIHLIFSDVIGFSGITPDSGMTEQMETANDRDNTGVNGTEPVDCHEDFDSDNDYGDIEVEDKMYSDSDKDTDDDDDDEGDDNNSDNDDENYDDDDINGDYVSDNDDGGGGEGDDDSDSGDDDDDQGDNDIENNEYNGEALHQDQDQILDPAPIRALIKNQAQM